MEIDPRGPRFGALITTVVFAVCLVIGGAHPAAAAALLAFQAVVFGIGTFAGLRRAPYGLIYKAVIRPRLGPPAELEAEAPPRFAQGVGFVIAILGVAGYGAGIMALGVTAAVLGLIAAFLNGVFGLCLGCEMYLLIRRIAPAPGTGAG